MARLPGMPGVRNGSRSSRSSAANRRCWARSGTPRPTRRWGRGGGAIKVVTHDKYTFYNPRLHPEFTPGDSPILIFEGTYAKTFSGTETATPRYDYNQVLYRLDLDELFK